MKSIRQHIQRLMLLLMMVLLSSAGVCADWTITVATMQNGTVKPSKKTAAPGDTVTLKVRPAEDYLLNIRSLRVELITTDGDSDTPSLTRRAPSVGTYATVTKTGDNTYYFVMPDCNIHVTALFYKKGDFEVEVEAETTDGSQQPVETHVTVVPDYETNTFTVSNVATYTAEEKPTEVHLPATVTDPAGNTLALASVVSNAFFGLTTITDIYLPDTEEMIDLEENCFLLDNNTGDAHQIAQIHTPLSLLDDYAVCSALSEHYEAGKIKATATAKHRFWTFSCGVDVELPDEVKPYIVISDGNGGIAFTPLETTRILANNGVLLLCPDNEGHAYDVTAIASSAHPTGSAIATRNAQSYPGNLLEPVIEKHHYLASRNYYVLVNNKFCPIQLEELDARTPACKAVLHMPTSNPYANIDPSNE